MSPRSLGYILDAAPCRLHHLVVGAAAPVDVSVAKPHGHVIDKLGHLKAFQPAVTAVPGDQFGHGQAIMK